MLAWSFWKHPLHPKASQCSWNISQAKTGLSTSRTKHSIKEATVSASKYIWAKGKNISRFCVALCTVYGAYQDNDFEVFEVRNCENSSEQQKWLEGRLTTDFFLLELYCDLFLCQSVAVSCLLARKGLDEVASLHVVFLSCSSTLACGH